jgi:hypothetical protein
MEKDSKKITVANPDYAIWRVHDQHVLTYQVMSLSREVLVGVASNTTSVDMWAVICKTFASQSHSRVLHLHNQLVATLKGDQSITTYFSTMRGYVDEMATAGKPLDDDDVVSYILNGLDADYNSLIEQANGMAETISHETLYSHLLDTEAHLVAQKAQRKQKEQYHMLANATACGSNNNGKQQHHGGFQGNRGGGRSSGRSFGNPNSPYKDHQCQVYGKLGHTTLRCWKRFDKNFTSPDRLANATTSSYNLDPTWCADSVATDHITGDG